jgi:hypothetical protein
MPVRWNSTYNMIKSACNLQIPITAVCAVQDYDNSVRALILTQADWAILDNIQKLFVIFVQPSQKLQGKVYPTMNYALPQYLRLLNKLELLRTHFGSNTTLGKACTSAYDKLHEYYLLIRKQNYSAVATICDLRFNMNVFQVLWPGLTGNANKNRVRLQFIDVFMEYQRRENAIQAKSRALGNDNSITIATIGSTIESDSESDLFKPRNAIDLETEFTRWMKQQPMKRDIDILRY